MLLPHVPDVQYLETQLQWVSVWVEILDMRSVPYGTVSSAPSPLPAPILQNSLLLLEPAFVFAVHKEAWLVAVPHVPLLVEQQLMRGTAS